MVRYKKGVKIQGIKPEIVAIIPVVEGVYKDSDIPELVITCVTDGKHKGHQHSLGYAIDIRTRNNLGEQFPLVAKECLKEDLQKVLTNEFDVVVESTHIHIEFDVRSE